MRERLRDGGKAQTPDAPDISVEPLKYHPGDTVADKYRLEALMGQGAMGSVWRAKNLALGVDVAIKLVHGEIVSDETTERLQREAHAAARIEHPSAVRIFDFGESHLGDPFIAMELLRGESLRDVFDKRGKIPADEAAGLLLPVMSALALAHQKGVVHRDLKPENIVIVSTEDGIVPKLVDFGLAKIESSQGTKSTAAGILVGSPDYMSPEQARADSPSVGAPSDIWAIGVMLYEAIAGVPPFRSTSLFALLRAINQESPPPLDDKLAPPALAAIIFRALEKDPKARWPSMRVFGKALAEWTVSTGADVDAAGNSLAAHWLRASRTSISSMSGPVDPIETPSLDVLSVEVARDAAALPLSEADAPVSQPSPSEKKGGSRWGLIGAAGLGVAAIAGGAIALAAMRPAHPAESPAETAPIVAASSPAPGPASASAAALAPVAATATASKSSVPTASASTLAPAPPPAPANPSACIASLFPDASFVPNTDLALVCKENDPRKGAAFLHKEIARQGLLGKTTTAGMSLWANLTWYELAVVATARGACCDPAKSTTVDLPPPIGTCPALTSVLENLTTAVRTRTDVEKAVNAFRETALCMARGDRFNVYVESPYDYQDAPDGGSVSAYRKILERALTR